MRGQFFYPRRLEYLANELLSIYERKKGFPVEPPIQADLVAESVGLDVLYEKIPEEPGRTVLAEIRPKTRLIVVNERRLKFIEENSEFVTESPRYGSGCRSRGLQRRRRFGCY